MKTAVMVAFSLLTFSVFAELQHPAIGFWRTIDDKTGTAKSIVRIYEYKGKVYGRVCRVLTDRTAKAKISGSPLIEGLDIIRDLRLASDGTLDDGKVLDPQSGRTYSCRIWIENGKLVMRGSLLWIGRKQVWLPNERLTDASEDIVPNLKF